MRRVMKLAPERFVPVVSKLMLTRNAQLMFGHLAGELLLTDIEIDFQTGICKLDFKTDFVRLPPPHEPYTLADWSEIEGSLLRPSVSKDWFEGWVASLRARLFDQVERETVDREDPPEPDVVVG